MLDPAFMAAARALIAADSVTERGNLRAVEVLEPICRDASLEPARLASRETPDRDANLLAGPGGGSSGPPMLLVTHLDTVDPGPRDRWRTDPFTLAVEGDRAFGLGVADVKLDALCKLWAAKRLKGTRLARPFWFLGTFGEEAGLRGAREFAETAPFKPRFVLCGEPCENRLHHAHKGYAMVRVRIGGASAQPGAVVREERFVGKAVHSSTPQLGVNAIDLALEHLSKGHDGALVSIEGGSGPNTIPAECVARFAEGGHGVDPRIVAALEVREAWRTALRVLEPARDERFSPAEAVGSVTMIRTVDATLELVMDARLLPQHDPERFLAAFRKHLSIEPLSIEIMRRSGGMDTPRDAEILRRAGRALASIGLDPEPVAKPTSTEGGVFARWGCEALVFGPSPTKGNAHTPNEFALLTQVERAIDAYEALLRELCAA